MKLPIFILIGMLVSLPSHAADPATGNVFIDQGVFQTPATRWFKPGICATDPGDFIYISVGIGETRMATFKVKRDLYEAAIPNDVKSMFTDTDGNIMLEVAKNSGCPENPLVVARVQLDSPEKFAGNGVIFTLAANREHDQHLLRLRDSGQAKEIEPGLLHSAGRQTLGGVQQMVEYYLAKDALQKTGGPLRARCVYKDDHKICIVSDAVNKSVNYESIIRGEPTLKQIHDVHDALEKFTLETRIR